MPSIDPLLERSRHFARTPAREGAAIIPATPVRAGLTRDV
jgi:hypothetical protein